MNIQWKKLIPCLLFPLAVGGLAGFLTRSSMSFFDAVQKPPLSPPGWLFPVVWTILYLLMGFASYLVLVSERPGQTAWKLYVIQLIFNFFWPIFFFNLEQYLLSFVWLLLLWLDMELNLIVRNGLMRLLNSSLSAISIHTIPRRDFIIMHGMRTGASAGLIRKLAILLISGDVVLVGGLWLW